MSGREITWRWPIDVVEANKELAELWIEEVDLLEIHLHASRESDNRVCGAVNGVYAQLGRCKTVLRGQELKQMFTGEDNE